MGEQAAARHYYITKICRQAKARKGVAARQYFRKCNIALHAMSVQEGIPGC